MKALRITGRIIWTLFALIGLYAEYCFTFLVVLALASSSAANTQPQLRAGKCVVQGKVIQQAGEQPLKKTTIQLIGRGQEAIDYSALTDGEGTFKFENVNPGRYIVLLEHAGFVQIRYGSNGRNNSLVLEPGQQIKDLVLRMQAAAVVTGKILDSDGDPMPSVSVSAARYGSSPSRWNRQFSGSGNTNDLGEYRIAGLEPGRYMICAVPPGGARRTSEAEKAKRVTEVLIYATTYYPGTADENQAVPVELHAGEEVPINFSVVKTRGFRVRGTTAKLPPGNLGEVMLRQRGDRAARADSGSVGSDGNFEFQDVMPGSYTLTLLVVSVPDMQMASSSETVIEVSDSDVDGVRLETLPVSQVRGPGADGQW